MKNVMITGANGFVGYYLVKQLLDADFEVFATSKGENRLPYQNQSFQYSSLDYTDGKAVDEFISTTRPAVIVHCAAISKPDECEQNQDAAYQSNVEATKHLLRAAATVHAHFIFLSTDFVFSGEGEIYREDDHRDPVNYYGVTKLLAEDEVSQYAYPWSIVRTGLVYGKSFSGRENIVTNTAKTLAEKRPLKIFDDQRRTPTYVEDLAAGILAIIDRNATGTYHLAGYNILSPYDVVIATGKHLGLDCSLITPVKEHEFDQPARRPPCTVLSIDKAKKDLGFQPRSFEVGLRQTFLHD